MEKDTFKCAFYLSSETKQKIQEPVKMCIVCTLTVKTSPFVSLINDVLNILLIDLL